MLLTQVTPDMVPVLLNQFRKFNFKRLRESILSVHSDPTKLLDKIAELEMEEAVKNDPEQFARGVKELAKVLVDPATNTQGLVEKQAELARIEKVLTRLDLKGTKRG